MIHFDPGKIHKHIYQYCSTDNWCYGSENRADATNGGCDVGGVGEGVADDDDDAVDCLAGCACAVHSVVVVTL